MAITRYPAGGGIFVCTNPTAFSSQSVMTLAAAVVTGTLSSSASKLHTDFLNIAASLVRVSWPLRSWPGGPASARHGAAGLCPLAAKWRVTNSLRRRTSYHLAPQSGIEVSTRIDPGHPGTYVP